MTGPRGWAGADRGLGVLKSNDSRALPGSGGILESSLPDTPVPNGSCVPVFGTLGPSGTLAAVGVLLRPLPLGADRLACSMGLVGAGEDMGVQCRRSEAVGWDHGSATMKVFSLRHLSQTVHK